ncbi:MAG TPA: fibronectin type III domain-containing protein [Mycobacteriales bacterium]|nr:fibronectin type III domain-containing protein [Mycobacteriales bacterium]
MPRPGHRTRAAATLAAAGLLCLGGVAGSGPAGASPPTPAHHTAAAKHSAGSGRPKISVPSITHLPDAYEMLAISCVSVKHCVAVGYGAGTGKGAIDGGVLYPVTDGKPGKPLISSDATSVFYGVSCVTVTRCVVVGEGTPTSKSGEVAEAWLWHGGKLSFIDQTSATTVISSEFRGVDCWSSTRCMAVGYAYHNTKTLLDQPIAVFASIDLKSSPTDDVVLNDTAGYAAAVTCPTSTICYAGGASVGASAEEMEISKHSAISGVVQTGSASGIEGIACESASSCEGAEVQDLPMFGQFQGWVEHLGSKLSGKEIEVTSTSQFYAIARVNSSYYLAVGEFVGSWTSDLVSASGKPGTTTNSRGGYLQGVACPVQTECLGVGFSSDSASKQPGGNDGVDGAIGIFHLKTAPGAPTVKVEKTGHHSAKVRITPPASDGDKTITSYRLTVLGCQPHHKKCTLVTVKTQHVKPSKLTVTVSGLKRHSTYEVYATATNTIGTGPASARKHADTH